ncbi:5-formyltetrahydrofolate cyclo-ligase [Sansalvadorimonas verongulae]|uniref:5-formyltetrahydrofolate cyclo-ligase n=1 Tax=Sansalvadorimonas verongulae TaxID=2172824 RepID=UPI0012BC7380|nr:5-formyltetrahydrofolate cyclo-ligase [Sansalvadorimonas verongulae]MTI12763.1 5-formyltetrahydrofolate cyclo-ligase [Sansalvadorimonas verongulae]
MNPTQPISVAQQKSELRKHLRQIRRSLTPAQQQAASQRLLNTLLTLPAYQNSQHVAVYIAADGEIDTRHFVEDAWRKGKNIYLPVVDPQGSKTLTFLPWQEDTVMINNKYGIPEPDSSLYQTRLASGLDLVLLPLTGFDEAGKRMGMGGGYYDRTFAFVSGKEKKAPQPQLIGLAHECQKAGNIPSESWDIPLTGVATDQRFYASLTTDSN